MSEPADALPVLTAIEARLLGCLIEKEATTPDLYPLTVNAAVSAANQKTAREPVMALDPGQVQHALRSLEAHGLARQQFSSRADRYEHLTARRLGLPSQQVVLLGLLLLRGPQTAHELLARSERMAKFADVDDLRHHLERLIQRRPGLVVQIPRGPGQREDRYLHLLGGPVDVAALAARAPVEAASPAARGLERGFEQRLAELEARVRALEARLGQGEDAADESD